MPVHPDTPEPLKTALQEMEAAVQSAKSSLAFAAPEMQDFHWGVLQQRLAEVIVDALVPEADTASTSKEEA